MFRERSGELRSVHSMKRLVMLSGLLLAACATEPITVPASTSVAQPMAEPSNWQQILPAQIAEVKRAVAPFRDYDTAKRQGWKAFGGEEPLMGRHYTNDDAPDYVYGQPLDFSRPNNLMYADIGGEKVLTGVAYVVRIAENEPVPAGFAGPQDQWHVHDAIAVVNAATEERPFVRWLAKGWLEDTYFKRGDNRGRLAMVHVWTETPNPDGVFASYDRTLPYRKLGLPAGFATGVDLDTARGVHMATTDGCKGMIDGTAWIGDLSRKQTKTLQRACEDGSGRVRDVLDRGVDAERLNMSARAAYADYRSVYDRTLDADQKRRIAAMTEHHHGEHHSPMDHHGNMDMDGMSTHSDGHDGHN